MSSVDAGLGMVLQLQLMGTVTKFEPVYAEAVHDAMFGARADGAALRLAFANEVATVVADKLRANELTRIKATHVCLNMLTQQWACTQTRWARAARFTAETMDAHCARAVKAVADRYLAGLNVEPLTPADVDELFVGELTATFAPIDEGNEYADVIRSAAAEHFASVDSSAVNRYRVAASEICGKLGKFIDTQLLS